MALNILSIFYSENKLRNKILPTELRFTFVEICWRLHDNVLQDGLDHNFLVIIPSYLCMQICICDRNQARNALFSLSDSGGGMQEFPESVNERIWKTASFVLSGPSLGERCPFTFVTSRQKMRCDVVRGQHLTPADDVGSAVTLPRKQWRHSGNPPAPLKNPDSHPFWKKGKKGKKKLIRQPH